MLAKDSTNRLTPKNTWRAIKVVIRLRSIKGGRLLAEGANDMLIVCQNPRAFGNGES